MTSYHREAPLHYALTYQPFTYSNDPLRGIIGFWKNSSDYLQRLSLDYPSFNHDANYLYIESEHPDMTFGLIEIGLKEYFFIMVDRELFDILSSELSLTIYRKDGNLGTSKFSANALLAVVECLVRRLLIDEALADLSEVE